VKSWIEETVYGENSTKLKCLNQNCEYGFPRDQIERALTEEELTKLDFHLQEIEIKMVGTS
jgi:hypothetical protein